LTERRLTAAIFLVGFSVILYELTLTRIFSVVMWYHFASLSIALALFGFAVGGVAVHLRPSLVNAESFPCSLAPWLWIMGGWMALPFGALFLASRKPGLLFPLLSFFHQPYFQPFRQNPPGPDGKVILSMAVLYVLVVVPFLAAGVVLAGLFRRARPERFGILYGADLAGAAAGCLIFVPGLTLAGAPSLLLAAAAAGIFSAALLAGSRKRYTGFAIGFLLITLALLNGPGDRLSPLPFARGQLEPGIEYSRWNAMSRVVVYPLSQWEAEQAWGISRSYRGRFPGNKGMLVDDAGYTPIIENREAVNDPAWAPHHIISLPHLLRPGSKTLIIGPGGGRDILAATGSGAGPVTAVELNPLIVDAVEKGFPRFSGGPYSLPGVTTIVGEGRSTLARTGGRFGIIQASSVFGEVAPSAGAFSLSANFLYTREAFRQYWEHLEGDGILSLSRSVFGLRALRLVSLARDLLLSVEGSDPELSIAVLRERGLATVMVARGGFSEEDIRQLKEIADTRAFTVEYLPGLKEDGNFGKAVRGEDVTGGRFDLSPPTDDRPFFYNNVPKSRFLNVFFKPTQAGERHIVVLRTMGLIFTGLVIFLLLLPLLRGRGKRVVRAGTAFGSAIFFVGIGGGYMLVELTIMHRLTLFLGHPTYSLTVTLVALLLASGAGSVYSARFSSYLGGRTRYLPLALILLILLMWTIAGLLSPVLGLPQLLRVLLVAALVSPAGFVMGLFMPLGLARLARSEVSLVPWAWALNGAASVAGSLGSLVVAMNFGYSAAMLGGVLSYALTVPFMRQIAAGGDDVRKEVLP
jgi:hypothetical protein